MAQLTFNPSQGMDPTSQEVAQSPNAQSPMDGAKKKKKSRKSKNKDASSPAPESNGLASSQIPEEERPQEKKRKLNSESGRKKQKKPKHNEDTPDSTPILEDNGLGFTQKGKPKKQRSSSRIGGRSNLKIGFFDKEEVQRLEAYKVDFCNLHGLADHKLFDTMVQHTDRHGKGAVGDEGWPISPDECTKYDFWSEIYKHVPERDPRSLYRFMRRHFQDSTQKPHEWTPEQDEELIKLMKEHPGKWAFVSRLLGRSDDDVTQRWKNQLEHREKMKRGKWDENEARSLLDLIQETWNKVYASEGDSAGKDMYEMDDKHLAWGVISDALGNVRSRQQCADKWRKVKRGVEILRTSGNPDFKYDPVEAATRPTTWISYGIQKSDALIHDDGDDEEQVDLNANLVDISTPHSRGTATPRLGFGSFPGTPEADAKYPVSEPDSEAESEADVKPQVSDPDSAPPSEDDAKHQVFVPESEPEPEASSKSSQAIHSEHSETDEPTETKEREARERKQRKKERREQKESEAANGLPSSHKEKKHKKRKKSLDAGEAENAGDKRSASTSPQKKKKKKKNRKSMDVNGAGSPPVQDLGITMEGL